MSIVVQGGEDFVLKGYSEYVSIFDFEINKEVSTRSQ